MQTPKATIFLTPRNDENDFTRSIILTPSDDPVIIGRASKTASKGLVPMSGNAWFNSPIMSREHGKLFLTPEGEIHVQDSASTHGTWIGQRRLASHESAKISDGDMVTFGTTVTSGPMTYHARSFDVRILLTSEQISPSSTRSKASGSSTFSVPNDDVESLSDDSDPGSCQILDSHPRTFSVPSSDDEMEDSEEDDVVIPTSRRLFLASVNARDSPKSQIRRSRFLTLNENRDSDGHEEQAKPGAPVEARSFSAECRSFPSSQEEDVPMIANTFDSDSEDEGPDVIHWGHGQHSYSTRKTDNNGTAATPMLMPEVQIPETYQSPDSHTAEAGSPALEMNSENRQATATSAEIQEKELHEKCDRAFLTEDLHEGVTDTTKTHVSHHRLTDASNNDQPKPPQYQSPTEHGQVVLSESGDNQDRSSSDQHDGGSLANNQSRLSPSPASSFGPDDTIDSEAMSAHAGSSKAHLPMKDAEQDQETRRFENLFQEEWNNYSEHEASKKDQGSSISSLPPKTYAFPIKPPQSNDHQHPWNIDALPLEPTSRFTRFDQPSINKVPPHPYLPMARPPSPSDAALPKYVTLGQTESYKPSACNATRNTPSMYYGGPRYGRSGPVLSSHYELPPAKFLGDLRSNPSMRAHRSSLETILAQASDDWQNEQAKEQDIHRPEPDTKPVGYQQGPFSPSFDSFHTAAESSQEDTRSTSPLRKQCVVKLKLDNPITETREPDNSLNMSRVQISNLVNSQGEGSRGKKRKSNQMSTEESPSTASSQVHTFSVPGITQEIVFDHDTASAANNLRPAGADTLSVKASNVPKVLVGSDEGPARKKAKVSSSKSGTVGKVVSGICLGVAGAFAALVAATPTDVWEEALREAVKLQ